MRLIRFTSFLLIAPFLLQISSFVNSQQCDYRTWAVPIGENFTERHNVKSWETCCDFCANEEICTAFSHHNVSEGCLLYQSHDGFEETPDSQFVSGVVLPANYSTTESTTTTRRVPECPTNNVDPTVRKPHENDCTQFYVCYLGVWFLESCWISNGYTYFDCGSYQCRSPAIAVCCPETTLPTDLTTASTSTTTPPTTTTGGTTTTPIPLDCAPGETAKLPHAENCSLYTHCIDGIGHVRSCPATQLFDSVSRECMPPANAVCYVGPTTTPTQTTPTTTVTTSPTTTDQTTTTTGGTTTTPIPLECPSMEPAKLPHAENCSLYTHCIDGIGLVRSCPATQLFDSVSRECMPPANAVCYVGPTTTPITQTTPTTTSPTTTTSSTTTTTTTSPTTSPTTTTTTTTPPTTTSPGSGSTLEPEECPSEGTVNIPHPTNCRKYTQCYHGDGFERDCNSGQKFDKDDRLCKPESEANCWPGAN